MSNKEFKEKLIAKAYKYSLDIVKFLDFHTKKDFVTLILFKQLARSATSVSANIVEAQAASSIKEFVNFLLYSLKSANETKFWLTLLQDSGKSSKSSIEPLLQDLQSSVRF